MEYRGFYISDIEDCDENEGGYYCQVYPSEDDGFRDVEIDNFCIHPDELDENPDIEFWKRAHIDENYDELMEIRQKSIPDQGMTMT